MLKDKRERENLRVLLKSDLEEKMRLKQRIQILTLETKDKSMKISELEANLVMKSKIFLFCFRENHFDLFMILS